MFYTYMFLKISSYDDIFSNRIYLNANLIGAKNSLTTKLYKKVVFTVNFEQISHIILVFLSLTAKGRPGQEFTKYNWKSAWINKYFRIT